jgi:hypothetical protein
VTPRPATASGYRDKGNEMALFAVAIPILPGKTEQWRRFIGELNGPRHGEFEASRRRLGVHERTFLQSTPMGDMVLVTLEGEDPQGAMARFGATNDEFTRWFVQQVKDLHGVDLTQPMPGALPEQVADSDRQVRLKAA